MPYRYQTPAFPGRSPLVNHCPDLQQFRQLAEQGNVVPVYRQLMADTLTPVSAFRKVARGPHAFLLESVAGPENIGRYCFVGADPFAVLTATRRAVRIEDADGTTEIEADNPLDTLTDYLSRFRLAHVPGLPRFSCGAVGYLGYDVVRYVEDLPDAPPDDCGLPDLVFMFFDHMLIFDHVDKTIKVVCAARIEPGTDIDACYRETCERVDGAVEALRSPVENPAEDIAPAGELTAPFDANVTPEHFMDAVRRCKEYIRAGDIFQVVISQRLHAETSASAFDIYRALRVVNPSPYMFYLKMDDLRLIGASPEVMTRVENRKITLRPIAGTRRRGQTEAEDQALAAELLADPKERAEHIMLVDLGRNDVGRVARYGTVVVDEIMVIERYSHVMHIVSNITGVLEDARTAMDALKACLPAGTLSGAPKVRAMEIIDEMETTRRGPYGGAVAYFDFSGNMDSCITIRTIVMRGSDVYVQAGAGIVADSVPEREHEECLNKARALLRAIRIAEQAEQSS
jgi:anthranilate synthase component 1